MNNPVKYECITASVAFDLVEHISNLGGNVCIIMNGNTPTSAVLSDFPFNKPEHEFKKGYISTRSVTDWDVEYFQKQMQ